MGKKKGMINFLVRQILAFNFVTWHLPNKPFEVPSISAAIFDLLNFVNLYLNMRNYEVWFFKSNNNKRGKKGKRILRLSTLSFHFLARV